MMEQQYMTHLAEAYKRGYEIRFKDKLDAPELKMHYFKVKEDLPRVQVVLSFLQGIVPAGQCQLLLDVGSGRGNHSREDIVPQPVIEKMLGKLVLPEAYEANKVEWKIK